MALAISSLTVAGPATAASCWDAATVEAAQIKEFDIALMVSTLRCRGKGVELTADYNKFVTGKRAVIKSAGDEIIRHYNQTLGGKGAIGAYDKFGVGLANKYGNGIEGLECEDIRAMIAEATYIEASRASLLTLAQRAGMDPPLAEGRCGLPAGTVIASAAPSTPAVAVASASPAVMTAAQSVAAPTN